MIAKMGMWEREVQAQAHNLLKQVNYLSMVKAKSEKQSTIAGYPGR